MIFQISVAWVCGSRIAARAARQKGPCAARVELSGRNRNQVLCIMSGRAVSEGKVGVKKAA